MIYKAILLALIVAILCGVSIGTFYSECDESGYGTVKSVDISNCLSNFTSRCKIKRHTNVSIDISFTTTNVSNTLKPVIHGMMLNKIPLRINGFKNSPISDGCKFSGVECPLKPNITYNYTAILPPFAWYQRACRQIKLKLRDDAGNDIICVTIPVSVR